MAMLIPSNCRISERLSQPADRNRKYFRGVLASFNHWRKVGIAALKKNTSHTLTNSMEPVTEQNNTSYAHAANIEKKPSEGIEATESYDLSRLPADSTELMKTAIRGDIKALRQLEKTTSDLGKQDSSGMTALMYAAATGNAEAVKVLAPHEKGIWSAEGDYTSKIAILLAAENGHKSVVDILAQYEGGTKDSTWAEYTSLMKAARNGHVMAVELLLPYEKALQNEYGGTALMEAADNGYTEIVRLLLGSEAGAQNKGGWTALMKAAYEGHTDTVRLLAPHEKGMRKKSGETALAMATYFGHQAIVDILSQYPEEK